MKQNTSLIRLLSFQLSVLFVLMTFIGGYFIINETISTFEKEKASLQKKILENKKNLLIKEVKRVDTYIQTKEHQTIKFAKEKLLKETISLHSILINIYNSLKDNGISEKIKAKIIINAVKDFSNTSNQIFNITTLKGKSIYHPELPHLIGTSILHLKDAHKTRVVNEEIGMVSLSNEGFLSTFWGKKEPFRQKITFIKNMHPLPWYITSSIYVDDFREEIQKSLYYYISNLRFGDKESGYFFINTMDGKKVLSGGKVYNPRPNIWDFRDKNGIKVVQQNAQIAKENADGNFSYYTWKNLDGSISPKISFVKQIPNWNMFLGAGVSLDIIDKKIKEEEKKLDDFLRNRVLAISVFLIISLTFVTFMMLYLTKKIQKNIQHFSLSFEKATHAHENISDETISFTEFRIIAKEANTLINKLKQQQQETYYKATHDYLTNLPNRMLMMDRLNLSIIQANRENEHLAVIFLDIDHFKKINDTFGHDKGDIILQKIAHNLTKVIRSSDTMARIGGDEFVFIIPKLPHEGIVNEYIERILEKINQPFSVDGKTIKIGGSLGVSIYPNDGKDSDTLLRHADIAMYSAKNNGRNNFQFFDNSMDIKIHEMIELEEELSLAIENEELRLYYQPKIDLRSGQVIGSEALIRWEHPIKGIIFPDIFIPLAEECGLILPMGKWIVREACQQYQKWRKKGHILFLAINISVKQLEDKEFVNFLADTLIEFDIPSEHIELEITESFAVHSPENVNSILALKKLGIRLAIDDFGTGYSSLSYINKLPIDTLKIDRSFVKDMLKNEDKKALVEIIIQTAKILNLQTVAEGVEHKDETNTLKDLGCNIYQGYLFSKPVPANEFEKLL